MEAALSPDMLATDLAYYLVRKGVSQLHTVLKKKISYPTTTHIFPILNLGFDQLITVCFSLLHRKKGRNISDLLKTTEGLCLHVSRFLEHVW